MARSVDLEAVTALAVQCDDVVAQVVRSHQRSTQSLIAQAVRQGAEVRLSYVPISGTVSIALVHRNGTSNQLFAAVVGEEADDDGIRPDGSFQRDTW
jgi:hypothetical protein